MKKLCTILFIFFLAACSSIMRGEKRTTCTNVPSAFTSSGTVIVIESYDEEIRFWTERLTMTREQLRTQFLQGENLTDDEINELFEYLNTLEAEGFELRLVSLSDSEVVIESVYDYTVISHEVLSDLWGVNDFEGEISLSAAIRGLEEQEAVVCDTINNS